MMLGDWFDHKADVENGTPFTQMYRYLFSQYTEGRQWFMVVEVVLCVTSGCLDAQVVTTKRGCVGMGCSVALLSVLYMICLLWLKPHHDPREKHAVIVSAAFQLAACVIVIVEVVQGELHGVLDTISFVLVDCSIFVVCANGFTSFVAMVFTHIEKQPESPKGLPKVTEMTMMSRQVSLDETFQSSLESALLPETVVVPEMVVKRAPIVFRDDDL